MALRVSNRLKFLLAGPVFETVYPWLPGQPHAELVEWFDHSRFSRVLEVCAGTGYLSRLVARRHPQVTVDAVDLSPHMVAAGRRRLGALHDRVHLREGDATALPFDDGTFDTVLIGFGLHELSPDTRRRAVVEATRVLRSGGRFATIEVDRPTGTLGHLVDAYLWVGEPPEAAGVCGPGTTDLFGDSGLTVIEHRPASPSRPTQLIVAEAP